ncbi:MAG: NifU family protein [Flavobacteriales bacterium]|jgi:Fe-S cluster biogenesis protein NfuA|nr:NifU family protein [Flavobacteriales bacterium]MBK7942634.1 NifU family protein [Flavobacteriales bacterium]MBK8950843.1 NifU family protein [Flavobacteriales bacterium]MBK9698962.1 NifU family protein [Flavobacteriales bacterium]
MSATSTPPPASVYAEMTPNPATMRFVSSVPLLPEGRVLEFLSPEQAQGVSPLAEKVFNLPMTTGVLIGANFITVTKNDIVSWDMVHLELREFIQEHMRNDGRVLYGDVPARELAEANDRAMGHVEPSGEADARIIAVLEEYVRPAVEGDGGHIAFRSFRDGVVTVTLRGSCSGCPSSMVTLKGGVENLLKQMVPGVREVVAEEL